jgi:hypothetical protein
VYLLDNDCNYLYVRYCGKFFLLTEFGKSKSGTVQLQWFVLNKVRCFQVMCCLATVSSRLQQINERQNDFKLMHVQLGTKTCHTHKRVGVCEAKQM